MNIRIFQGTSLLNETGYSQNGKAYIPCAAVDSYSGLWERRIVFLSSPLAGKNICLAVLCSDAGANIPPALEGFVSLCSAAGARITYHDGSGFPRGDFILAIEPGGNQLGVKYLGAAYGSRPLARKIAANFKQGLGLPYLPDPIPFDKPHYNLKLKLRTRLFTPAVAVQWPRELDLGPWLFSSLMEYCGGGVMDASEFVSVKGAVDQAPLPSAVEVSPPPPTPPPQILPQESGDPETITKQPRQSASMSRAIYPQLFSEPKKRKYKKEPFS